MGAVNCDADQELCSQYGVKGFPTIKAFVNGKPQDYNGDRSAKALTDWALKLVPSGAVQHVDSMSKLEALFGVCKGGGKGGKKASSALCVVLVTDKAETSTMYKALAHAYSGKVSSYCLLCTWLLCTCLNTAEGSIAALQLPVLLQVLACACHAACA